MAVSEFSRRQFLGSVAAISALGATGGLVRSQSAHAAGPLSSSGAPLSMAMHIHASFSEGIASMEAHLRQAQNAGIDVVWWSEHDIRMSALDYRQAVHFDALTEWENGTKWTWKPVTSGSLASSSGAIVTQPVSPGDDHPPGAMHLAATGATDKVAVRGFNGTASNSLFRTSLDGQILEIDVFPTAVGTRSYLEVQVVTSYRPARGGIPAGNYQLSYRVGGYQAPGTRTRNGRTGVVTHAAPLDTWTTLRLNPAEDLAAIFSGVDGRDAASFGILLRAVSTRRTKAEGYFDNLRFRRQRNSGDLPLQTQAELMGLYRPQFPGVTQHQGLEMSGTQNHIGRYGGALSLPDYESNAYTSQSLVALTHDAGGIASYNHPFGSHGGAAGTEAEQESRRREVAGQLISTRALGCDILEVGYRLRSGVNLARHAAVWDSCSRNAIFLTGTGVSDDHTGTDWLGQKLNFVTWSWADDPSEQALVSALQGGRSYFGDPALFRGRLDLLVDGAAPMGSATVSTANQRTLRIDASGLPTGGSVDVVTGVVDLAGASTTDPGTSTVTTAPAAAFSTGFIELPLNTAAPAFARVVVKDAGGVIVALSNPVWMLREEPPGGIPVARRAP